MSDLEKSTLALARDHIKAHRYAEALKILQPIAYNPTAQTWIDRIKQIEGHRPQSRPRPAPQAPPVSDPFSHLTNPDHVAAVSAHYNMVIGWTVLALAVVVAVVVLLIFGDWSGGGGSSEAAAMPNEIAFRGDLGRIEARYPDGWTANAMFGDELAFCSWVFTGDCFDVTQQDLQPGQVVFYVDASSFDLAEGVASQMRNGYLTSADATLAQFLDANAREFNDLLIEATRQDPTIQDFVLLEAPAVTGVNGSPAVVAAMNYRQGVQAIEELVMLIYPTSDEVIFVAALGSGIGSVQAQRETIYAVVDSIEWRDS